MPLDPIIGGALLSTGGNALSNLISNSGSKRSQNRANKHNVEFWNKQNAYNDPSAQMARLRKAGLNPNLIYGSSPSGAGGNASPIAPEKAADYNFNNPLQDIRQYSNIKQDEAQTNNLRTENDVIIQKGALIAAQTAGVGITNATNDVARKLAEGTLFNSLEASKESLRQLQNKSILSDLDVRIKDHTVKDRIMQISYEAQNARENLTGIKLQNALKLYEIQLNKMGIQKNDNIILRLLGKGYQKINEFTKNMPNKYKF